MTAKALRGLGGIAGCSVSSDRDGFITVYFGAGSSRDYHAAADRVKAVLDSARLPYGLTSSRYHYGKRGACMFITVVNPPKDEAGPASPALVLRPPPATQPPPLAPAPVVAQPGYGAMRLVCEACAATFPHCRCDRCLPCKARRALRLATEVV